MFTIYSFTKGDLIPVSSRLMSVFRVLSKIVGSKPNLVKICNNREAQESYPSFTDVSFLEPRQV